jgi:hypothetical protein
VRVEFAPLPPIASPLRADSGVVPDHLNAGGLRSSADPAFFRTALQAGLLGVMANIIPFGLGMVLTGILAALLYHRANTGTLRAGKAARLGAMAGAIAFAATALLTVLAIILLNSQQKFHDFMMQAIEQGVANQSGPDVQSFLQWLHTPQGFGTILAFGMLGALLLSMLFSAVGGVVGSTLFRDRRQPPL